MRNGYIQISTSDFLGTFLEVGCGKMGERAKAHLRISEAPNFGGGVRDSTSCPERGSLRGPSAALAMAYGDLLLCEVERSLLLFPEVDP